MSRELRAILVDGPVAYVPLTRDYRAVIDAVDIPLVAGRNWSALVSKRRKAVYAARVETTCGAPKMILMHRLLSNAPDDVLVDHKDGDGLNNRRVNVRHCTRAQNNLNIGLRKDNRSRLKGVSLDKRINRWKAEIQRDGRRKFLGHFASAADAYAAYCAAAAELHGDFARTK